MSQSKKVTFIATLAVLISLSSLLVCFGFLETSNSLKGVSREIKSNWDVQVSGISILVSNNNSISQMNGPTIIEDKIKYGIRLNEAGGFAQFHFDIVNHGDIDAKIKDIRINGLNEYNKYVSVELASIKEGDIIKSQSRLSNIEVLTKYNHQITDELMIPKIVDLNDISIEIEFEKVE